MSPQTDTSLADELREFGAATFDFVVASVCLAVIVGVPLVVASDLTGGLLQARTVNLAGGQLHVDPIPVVVAVVALGGSYPFVAEPRLLDQLTAFVRTFLLSLLAFAVVASIPLLAVGGVSSDSAVAAAGQVAVVAAAYVVTTWLHSSGTRTA